MMKTLIVILIALPIAVSLLPCASGQASQAPSAASPALSEREAAGSEPDNPGPLASDLSPKLKRKDILAAIKKVADWQIRWSEGRYNIGWTYAALYDGLLAASHATGDNRYHDRVLDIARANHFELGPRFGHADDEAIGLTYLTLYSESHDPATLSPTRDGMDKLLARPDDPNENVWWWCDALYMAPKVLAQLSVATGDRRYFTFMDHEWSLTSSALYDPGEHLFYRDKRFLTTREANGKKVFWSRGNGWVLAGLAMVLERMKADDPLRAKYIAQYRDMAERVAGLQPADGLWRASLLDPDAYPSPEISGTGFFTYGIAWGIHHHILDRRKYLPVVARAWSGMIAHVYQDGRLGSIQPIGGEPGKFKASSSYVYGVGAFLLVGSELSKISGK